ncbi:MAG: MoxR family ATPase [Chloroflexota bacterium]
MTEQTHWPIFTANGTPHDNIIHLPDPPPWRTFKGEIPSGHRHAHELEAEAIANRQHELPPRRTTKFEASPEEIELINAAIYLRRPLLVTGKPGIGKSTLAYAIAHELQLGPVLLWAINSRSTLQDALYRYDAIGRLQETQMQHRSHLHQQHFQSTHQNHDKGKPPKPVAIGEFIRLGPLGTALLPSKRPRILLIDEIDKSDIDLPHDLLNIFEEGSFEVPELVRLKTKGEAKDEQQTKTIHHVHTHDGLASAPVTGGHVTCNAFPIVVLTSNGEREFPAPFLRRCIRLHINPPNDDKLNRIVKAHFGNLDEAQEAHYMSLIYDFINRRDEGDLATDQLLNAIYLSGLSVDLNAPTPNKQQLIDEILRRLSL